MPLSGDGERVIGFGEVEVGYEAANEAVQGFGRKMGCWEEDEDGVSSRWKGSEYECGQFSLVRLG